MQELSLLHQLIKHVTQHLSDTKTIRHGVALHDFALVTYCYFNYQHEYIN